MNPKRFGIMVSLIVMALAVVFIVISRILAPDRPAIMIGGIIFLILGIVYLIVTIILNRKSS